MTLTHADAEEYTESLGQIFAGSWRQILWAERQGVPHALGLSVQEWVEKRLGGYVRMSIPERREAVAELSSEGMSTRDIADVLGVSHTTVERDAGTNVPEAPGRQLEPEAPVGTNVPAHEGRYETSVEDDDEYVAPDTLDQFAEDGDFDLTSLGPREMTRDEKAYWKGIEQLLPWTDVRPEALATSLDVDRLDQALEHLALVSDWLARVTEAITERRHQPFTVVTGGRNGSR